VVWRRRPTPARRRHVFPPRSAGTVHRWRSLRRIWLLVFGVDRDASLQAKISISDQKGETMLMMTQCPKTMHRDHAGGDCIDAIACFTKVRRGKHVQTCLQWWATQGDSCQPSFLLVSRDLVSITGSGFDSDSDGGSLMGQEKGCWREVATTTVVVVEGQGHRKGRKDSWARATRHGCEMGCSKIS
jgi:hypothetical protein